MRHLTPLGLYNAVEHLRDKNLNYLVTYKFNKVSDTKEEGDIRNTRRSTHSTGETTSIW